MPTQTLTITDLPTFGAVGVGYKFTGTVSLETVVDGAIRINSAQLHYHYGRVYVAGPYLNIICGDTALRTDVFKVAADSTLRLRNPRIVSWTTGTDHILRQNGRKITFTVARDSSTSANVLDRPRAGNMTLDIDYTILQSGLTLDRDRVNAGERVAASIRAGDAAYAHKLTFAAGSRSETMELSPGEAEAEFLIPMEWLEEIPHDTELAAACTLATYSGETLMGAETVNFTVLCPQGVIPQCRVTVSPENGYQGLYLSGRSRASLAVEDASTLYGAEVVGYRLFGSGYDLAAQTALFGPLSPGEHVFTARVTDSRGRVGESAVTVTALPYAAPTLSGIEVYRSNEAGEADDEGAYIFMKAQGAFAPLEGANTAVLEGRYRPAAGAWSQWQAFEGETLMGGGLLATVSYEAQLRLTDGPGNTAGYLQRIPTSQVAFNLKEGGGAAAFGRYAEREKTLAIPEDWRFIRGETDIEAAFADKLGREETAVNALKLGGQAPEAYVLKSDLKEPEPFHLTLLWTNEAAESSFAPQTLAMDLSGCCAVVIQCRATASLAMHSIHWLPVDGSQYALRTFTTANYYRYCTAAGDGLTFGAGRKYSSYGTGSTDDNNHVVPSRIWGIKGEIV